MPDWAFHLCHSPAPGADPTTPLSKIGWLRDAKSRTLNLAMGRAGDLGFTYNVFNKWSEYMFGGPQFCILALRDNEEVWSGPIANHNGQANSRTDGVMTVKAVGWLELLTVRELREDATYGPTNPGTGAAWKDWEIIQDLLARVISYDVAHAPPIRWGGHFGTAYDRQMKWTKGTKIEQCFRDLMELEAGCDIKIDPSTRQLYVSSWDTYTDRPEVVFGFNKPPFNVENFSWQMDFMAMRNRMLATGSNTSSALVEDDGSQDTYGIFEETVNLPGVSNSDTLLRYAGAEVALKANPQLFYSFLPTQLPDASRQPRLLKDFQIGDRGRFSVDFGPIQEEQTAVRFFGASFAIDDIGGEKITSLSILANAA